MSKHFERKLQVARVILRQLEPMQMRWTPLLKNTVKAEGTPRTFHSMMRWLLKNKYVERPEKGVYRITEKGRVFLSVLPN